MLGSSSITRIRLAGIVDLLARNHDADGGARTKLAAEKNGATVLVDDFFGVRHTETESLLLSCIERFENFLCLLFTDPMTGVGDFELKGFATLLDVDAQSA